MPYAMPWVSLRDSQPTSFRPGCALFQKWRQHRDIVSGAAVSSSEVMIGRARFNEIARGQISDIRNGLMKMVADPTGERLLGVQIIGEGARHWPKPIALPRLTSWVTAKIVSPHKPHKNYGLNLPPRG